MMGLEEHLIMMFRDDFEFSANATSSHLGHGSPSAKEHAPVSTPVEDTVVAQVAQVNAEVFNGANPINPANLWDAAAEKELGKIPFFVRGKARRNTEKFAVEHGISQITIETLYDAKAHYGR
jgi:light-independent protochlorophyllide reductase subunit B